jgi:hypothetical protein
MDNVIEGTREPKKEWRTPELKEIDIEEITAVQNSIGGDGGTSGHSKS